MEALRTCEVAIREERDPIGSEKISPHPETPRDRHVDDEFAGEMRAEGIRCSLWLSLGSRLNDLPDYLFRRTHLVVWPGFWLVRGVDGATC